MMNRLMSDLPLPKEIEAFTQAYVYGLRHILGSRLYGIYQHGASVFPEAKPVQDIDCHVILKRRLSKRNRQEILDLEDTLIQDFTNLGDMLDVYYILLKEARRYENPQHQLNQQLYDTAWPLHCAHIRAGRYRVLIGPEPNRIFPAPSWQAICKALDSELVYIQKNLNYPAYCILNLCRILYSFATQDPAVSKQACGMWACQKFPNWELVIQAALRFYRRQNGLADEILMRARVETFLTFALEELAALRAAATH
jgi:hypothetical protein